MAIDLQNLIQSKVRGISVDNLEINSYITSGAIDVLEKIKTYKQEDLQKFLIEEQVYSGEEYVWTQYNATGLLAWEIMEVKRSSDITGLPGDTNPSQGSWRNADRLAIGDKSDYINRDSLKFISGSFPGYTIESYSNITDDGDNDALASVDSSYNYIVNIYPQVESNAYHSWKIKYIPMPTSVGEYGISDSFHASYYPALAVYVAKNLILN
jgi:hypothetical protein